MPRIFVVNSQGVMEAFSPRKVWRSARRAGASPHQAQKAVEEASRLVVDGMSTQDVYNIILGVLGKESPLVGMRLNLKRAIQALGPTGFPFEQYVSSLWRFYDYKTKVDIIWKGKCVPHEVDIEAQKDKDIQLIECKYRVQAGGRVDLHDLMASWGYFYDIGLANASAHIHPLIITNNKFTSEAIAYGECMGLNMIGWRYPKDRGLEYIIESKKLYPVTILPSFKGYLAEILKSKDILMVRELLDINIQQSIRGRHLNQASVNQLYKEAKLIVEGK
ncbi:MAG: hypothetical protein NTX26_02495 [Candidatus Parcubacteria bacterium]|nr:hypothetical protein [Candidatus Parcubacteria bacterium]